MKELPPCTGAAGGRIALPESRRDFLKMSTLTAGALLLSPMGRLSGAGTAIERSQSDAHAGEAVSADYALHIQASAIEIAPKRIISLVTYNGQFPGPLLRFKEGRQVTVDIFNDTDTPEQLHWHGQKVPTDVDGAAEEGTPYIPAHGKRRIAFIPRPSGFRFYHTHNRAGANLYAGEVGAVYIDPEHEPGRYDREVFLVLKAFEPSLSRGGDMSQDFLSPPMRNKELESIGEAALKAPVAKGMTGGTQVGYGRDTTNCPV